MSNSHEPYLARFSVPRSPAEAIPGSYDETSGSWVVTMNGRQVPLIDTQMKGDLAMKTMATNERESHSSGLLEITTKTEANLESDDQKALLGASLELTTKTAAHVEGDDTHPKGSGLW